MLWQILSILGLLVLVVCAAGGYFFFFSSSSLPACSSWEDSPLLMGLMQPLVDIAGGPPLEPRVDKKELARANQLREYQVQTDVLTQTATHTMQMLRQAGQQMCYLKAALQETNDRLEELEKQSEERLGEMAEAAYSLSRPTASAVDDSDSDSDSESVAEEKEPVQEAASMDVVVEAPVQEAAAMDVVVEEPVQEATVAVDVAVEAPVQEATVAVDVAVEEPVQEATVAVDVAVEAPVQEATAVDVVVEEPVLQTVAVVEAPQSEEREAMADSDDAPLVVEPLLESLDAVPLEREAEPEPEPEAAATLHGRPARYTKRLLQHMTRTDLCALVHKHRGPDSATDTKMHAIHWLLENVAS